MTIMLLREYLKHVCIVARTSRYPFYKCQHDQCDVILISHMCCQFLENHDTISDKYKSDVTQPKGQWARSGRCSPCVQDDDGKHKHNRNSK